MFANLPHPTLFAHRGASAYAPENTLVAFELAAHQNADAIELGAKLSRDGQVVVIHDQTVDRTTDGSGKVGELTLAEIKELDAGSTYDQAFRGEKIPTLNEVFEAVGGKLVINIELTNYASPLDGLPKKVATLTQAHALENHVLFSSFNPIALFKIHKLLPSVPLGLLAIPGVGGAWARSFLGRFIPYQALHPEIRDTTEGLIHHCHQLNKRVHTYTLNHAEPMLQLFKWGIDGVFTDDPPLAHRTRSTYQEQSTEV